MVVSEARAGRWRRWLGPVALVGLIVAVTVAIVSTRSGGRTPSADGSATASTDPTSPSASSDGPAPDDAKVASAEALWGSFPISADPRPVVIYPGEDLQPGGFPDGDTKVAFMEGRVDVTAALPSNPPTMDGYDVISAADAVQLMKDEAGPGPIGGPPDTVVLHIVDMQLVRHTFSTDRGETALPAWQVTFDGVPSPAYVLALPEAERFSVQPNNGSTGSAGSISSDGKSLTVGFVARQDPTSPCDPGFASQM